MSWVFNTHLASNTQQALYRVFAKMWLGFVNWELGIQYRSSVEYPAIFVLGICVHLTWSCEFGVRNSIPI